MRRLCMKRNAIAIGSGAIACGIWSVYGDFGTPHLIPAIQTSAEYMSKIIAVVVAYQPNLERLYEQFSALLLQVQSIVVVDNGPGNDVLTWTKQWSGCEVHCISLGQNMGIAHAQNRGIEWARSVDAVMSCSWIMTAFQRKTWWRN